jgi:hypothetical protein
LIQIETPRRKPRETTPGPTSGRLNILRETSGATTTKYIHGTAIDEPLAQEEGGGTLTYLHAEGIGSVVKTTDAARRCADDATA